jgi:hypothetical protein
MCLTYGTCCPDKAFKHLDMPSYYHCIKNNYTTSDLHSTEWAPYYHVVTSCPIAWPVGVNKDKCERFQRSLILDPILHLPVTSRTTGHTYRNTYCAHCHGDPEAISGLWTVNVSCSESVTFSTYSSTAELLRDVASTKSCIIIFSPKTWMKTHIQSCTEEVEELTLAPARIDMCNVTGRWRHYDPDVVWACAQYTVPYGHTYYSRLYTNVFCRACNEDFTGQAFISECNVTGLWARYDADTDYGCSHYMAEEFGRFSGKSAYGNASYRNQFCCMCNINFKCRQHNSKSPDQIPAATFRYMFDFSSGIGELLARLESDTVRCQENEIFDTHAVCIVRTL